MRSFTATALAGCAIAALAVSLASCGGSQTVGAAPANDLPSSATETSSTTTSVVYPTIGIIASDTTLGLTLPPGSTATSVTETISAGPPAGFSALSSKRAAQAVTATPLAYVEITSTAPITFAQLPAFAFTLSAIAGGTNFALDDSQSGSAYAPTGQTATVSGSTVTFAAQAASLTVTPSAPVTFVLYGTTGATPIPSPSVSPSSLVFDAASPNTPQTVSIANAGTAAVTGSIVCMEGVMSPSPEPTGDDESPEPTASPSADPYPFVAQFANGTESASATPASGTATFSIVGGAELGTCTATFTTGGGTVVTTAIEVDEVDGGLYSVHRVKH